MKISPLKNDAADTTTPSGGWDPSAMQKLQMAQGIGGIFQGLFGREKRRDEQRRANRELQKRQSAYENMDFGNLAAGLQNRYAGMQNTFEDLTVNQQQAQFEAQQGAQSQANIMQNLRGAAGSSGVAGLAQAMANQSQIATQKASASIGAQEAQNQQLAARAQANLDMAQARGQAGIDIAKLQGATSARTLETGRTETMLGMAMKRKGRADEAIQNANAALYGGIGSLATTALTGGFKGIL